VLALPQHLTALECELRAGPNISSAREACIVDASCGPKPFPATFFFFFRFLQSEEKGHSTFSTAVHGT
jgi:hypothetical protein